MFHWLLAGLLLIVPFFILRALLPRPSSGKVWRCCQLNMVLGNIVPFPKVRTTLVLGSGGHTAELLGLVDASYLSCEDCVNKHSFQLLEYCSES